MSQKQRPTKSRGRPVPSSQQTVEQIQEQMRLRAWRMLNYLSIALFTAIVYGGFVLADYLLFSFIWWLMEDEIRRFPWVANAVEWAQVGLALMGILGAIVHGIFSLVGQIQLDRDLADESGE